MHASFGQSGAGMATAYCTVGFHRILTELGLNWWHGPNNKEKLHRVRPTAFQFHPFLLSSVPSGLSDRASMTGAVQHV